MSEILDEELKSLLNKHNIPIELFRIIADDAVRISLDDRITMEKGLTFCSNDAGKLFAITRCIEKLRRANSVYATSLDIPGCIEYVEDKKSINPKRKEEQIIDLDNLNMERERKKSVFRYVDSLLENTFSVRRLTDEIDQMSRCYDLLDEMDEKIKELQAMRDFYKNKIDKIENSIVPNIFRHKELKLYNKRALSYIRGIEIAKKERFQVEERCAEAEVLITPRKRRTQKILGFNGVIGNRVSDLMKKYKIPQQEIKKYLADSLHVSGVSEKLLELPVITGSKGKEGEERE